MEISAADTSYNSSYGSSNKILGKDDFLKLLTVQLRFQNPLNPLDSTEFTTQLAQFSSLEQLNNMNTQLNDLLLYQKSLQNTLTTSLIGKKVKVSGNEFYLTGEAEVSYTLPEDVSNVKISFYDSFGKLLREVETGYQTAGDKSYTWDGKDSNGNVVTDGNYSFKVEAFDASGNSLYVDSMVYGTVTGITFDNNTTYLIIDEKLSIQLSAIKEIKGGV
ncbi:MAG: flagellar hook capping FlgD N-terminal domain-containing protein [Nitrospirota bacterium]